MRTCVSRVGGSVTGLESVSLTRRSSVAACVVSRAKLAPMPSVEMRRSTRVFVPKSKDAEGVKVLRSGRKVWVESGEAKIKTSAKLTDGQDLFRLIGDSDEAAAAEAGWKDRVSEKGGGFDAMVVEDDGKTEPLLETRGLPSGLLTGAVGLVKRFGVVYSRKRKRCVKSSDSDVVDRRFGLHFFHRKRRRAAKTSGSLVKSVDQSLCVTVDTSCDGSFGIAGVVSSVLRYMWTAKVGLMELSGFLQSQPVAGVFGSYGIRFLLNKPFSNRSQFCKIYGTRDFTPMFNLDFSCVPLYFIHLHASMWLRSLQLTSLLLKNVTRIDDDDSELDDDVDDDVPQCTSFRTHLSDDGSVLGHESSNLVGHESSNLGGLKMLNVPFGVSRSAMRALPYRNGVVTRSASQRRRKRSMRTRRARNPSFLGVHRNGSSVLDPGIRKNVGHFPSSVLIKHENQKSVQKNSSDGDIKFLKSNLIALGKDIDSVSCSANLLIVDSDRCYRESGVCVTLELSTSNEWILAIRKDGSLRYYHRAQRGEEVKPTCTNRFTYAIIWCVEGGWKLEFTVRKDWAVFKELFKVCGDRNIVPPSPAKAIPIPGVFEVSDCGSSDDAPYVRPESYIKTNDDELSRTLLKRSTNYDMDSGDEEWLSTFKSKSDPDNGLSVPVTEGTFELMIDAFEKAAFCSPDEFSEEKAPADLCLDLASREVVEAMYRYWMTKRKRKRAPLLRVFQLNEAKKTPLVTKPVLRKKRSMKQRHTHTAKPTPSGRGKELKVLQAIAAEQNANEEKTAMLEVEQARAAARSAMEAAVEKRRRAQTLMASADLAMYRAAIAVRIAEAARTADPDQAIAHFLD